MGFWQIVMIVYFIIYTVCGLVMNGKPRTGKYSIVDIVMTEIMLALVLYEGGFWN